MTEQITTLDEIAYFRGAPTVGGNPHHFVELIGGKEIPMVNHEPSADTFRSHYYYNIRQNMLFMKTLGIDPKTKQKILYWKRVSEY